MKPTTVLVILAVAISSQPAAAQPSTPKLHPIEAACVTYNVSGQVQSGTLTRCHRDFGHEQYELQDLKVGIGGFAQTQKQRVLTKGDTIYTIDLATNTATKTKNPFYDRIAAGLAKSSPEKVAADFLSAMGYAPTGARKTIAGADCSVYNSSMLGSACFTDGGLMLEQSVMGNSHLALRVSAADAGEDGMYDLPSGLRVSDGPSVQGIPNLKDLLRPPGQ